MNDNPLDGISIASPCSADWNQMQGDERRRFCGACKLHVHDLSAMTAPEAAAVLRGAGQGRVCVRFFRRADGTVLTRDCPVGLRQRLRRAWARAAALWLSLWASTACTRPQAEAPVPAQVPQPVPLQGAVPPLLPLQGECVMGDVAPPAPPADPAPIEWMGRIVSKPVEPKK